LHVFRGARHVAAEVVTKDMLDPGQHDETTWAALDFMTAEGAGMCHGSWKMGQLGNH
jgi:hypothetical protein